MSSVQPLVSPGPQSPAGAEPVLQTLLGVSGSRKSTPAQLLGGLDVATSGRVYYREGELTNASETELTLWIAPTAPGFGLLLVLDPGQFLMERKMLLGIKGRAERLAG